MALTREIDILELKGQIESRAEKEMTDAQRQYVLRRPPFGSKVKSAHDMGREYRVQSGLNKVDFPAPTMRVLCTDHDVLGADFYIMDFITGRVLATAQDTVALTAEQCRTLSASQIGSSGSERNISISRWTVASIQPPK